MRLGGNNLKFDVSTGFHTVKHNKSVVIVVLMVIRLLIDWKKKNDRSRSVGTV